MPKKNGELPLKVKLKAALKARGLSANGAADLMDGVSHQSLRNLLSGHTAAWDVRVSTAQEISRVFKRQRVNFTDFYMPNPTARYR